MNLLDFLNEYDQSLLIALGAHLRMVGIAMLVAPLIAVPLGAWCARSDRAARTILLIANVVQTIPSIALFGLMIPILALVNRGIGALPATIALILYAQLPIIRNTFIALSATPADAIDAAFGIGMTPRQVLLRVALPLATPGIISGIRVAATMSVGVAAVAAYIGAGGLGQFIVRGIQTTWDMMTIVGAAGIALLALAIELLLELAERLLTPRGIRLARRRGR